MSGLEKIINEIQNKADAEAAEILNAAKKDCDAYLAKQKKAVAGEVADFEKKALQERELYQSKADSGADFLTRNELLKAKQNNIELVLDRAYQKMVSLPEQEYFAMILKILDENVLPKEGEICFGEKDLARMTEHLEQEIQNTARQKGGSLKVSKNAAPISDGFILKYGMIEENCTFKALFDANREQLKDVASRELMK